MNRTMVPARWRSDFKRSRLIVEFGILRNRYELARALLFRHEANSPCLFAVIEACNTGQHPVAIKLPAKLDVFERIIVTVGGMESNLLDPPLFRMLRSN